MGELRTQTTLFCAVLAFAIALSMLLRGRRLAHWLFAAFSVDIAFWYASQSLYGLFQAPIWVRATGVLTVLLPQLAVHTFQAIDAEEKDARPASRSALVRVATAFGLPMLALVLSPYHAAPLALGVTYFYVFGFLAAALVSLARRGQNSPSRAHRERVQFLVATGAVAMTFTLADFLSFLGVILPPIGAVLSIVFLYVLAESLARPRLADLYDISGRLLVATALAFCLAGIFYVFVSVLGRFSTMYLNAVLAAIVFLVLFEPLRDEVESRIHRFFFRERHALETSVAELRRRLAHVLEMDEMVTTLLGGLELSRRITSCAVYLRDQEGNGFDLAATLGATAPARIEALAARPILERLEQQASLSLEAMAREPNPTDATVLAAVAALGLHPGGVLLSVRLEGDDLVGVISVADDRVRDAFTEEEVTLLETVAAQVGVAVANSRVYSRMKERDRLAALGEMAAGLAHEVKNPLGAIKGAAQLLEEGTAPLTPPGAASAGAVDPSSREFIGIILEEVNRLDRVVGSFLDYARPHAGNPVPLDINAAVRRTVQILSSQQTDGVEITLELTESQARAKIDPEKLRQVLINLVQNAIQAMDGRGRVTVSTSTRRPRPHWTAGGPVSERSVRGDDGEVVEVSVRDTGPGISQKVLKNLFIPFFTTKEQGTGLGLAISQSIIQGAGGAIQVQTHPGAGTTFTIVLPAATGTLHPPAPDADSVDIIPAAPRAS